MSDEQAPKASSEESPKCPYKPAANVSPGCCGGAGGGKPMNPDRRGFLIKLGIGMNVVAGAMVGIPVLGYVLSSFRKGSPQSWISLGPAKEFEVGRIKLATYQNPGAKSWDGATAEIPCWVRRISDTQFQIFAINCTHLGCPVRWFEESKLFLCPCHGGAYYEDGAHAAGPPPRGLYEYEYRLENDHLQVKGGQIPTLSQTV